MNVAQETAVVFRGVFDARLDKVKIDCSLVIRRVESEGSFVADDCLAELIIAIVSITEIV